MEKGTVSVCFVEGLVQGFAAKGFEPDELLEQCGLSSVILNMPHARVSVASYAMLLRLVAQILDDEFFGQDSRRMKVGSFALLCRSVIHCKTLEKAMSQALRFFALCLDDLKAELQHGDNTVRLLLRDVDRPAAVFAHETMLAFLHRLACWLVNRRIPVLKADFRYEQPLHADEYRLLFCQKCYFGQAATALTFDARYFSLPVVRSDKSLKDFLRIAPDNLLVQYRDRQGIGAKLQKILLGLAPADWPSFDDIAARMGSSGSTLRRRLEADGLSYQVIKDHLRRDMAIDLLTRSEGTVLDIASALGFAEASAFHRAFRKWMGVNPGEYRKAVLGGE
ncbi:MAG TPA: AraC family transcriptional regulator [Rhodospirillaceae bacterium]|nr:AraC family transcriptional regulator [Rhodospirillaceae bacterium]